MKKIYTTEGPIAFYRGLLPSLFGVTHAAIQFPIYEYLKHGTQGICDAHFANIVYIYDNKDEVSHQIQGVFIASMVSKAIATILIFPHEVFTFPKLH